MHDSWPTQLKDLMIAQQILQIFSEQGQSNLSLFELVVDYQEKKMNYQLAPWVHALADRYAAMYGEERGEIITRKVISRCMRDTDVVH